MCIILGKKKFTRHNLPKKSFILRNATFIFDLLCDQNERLCPFLPESVHDFNQCHGPTVLPLRISYLF